MEEQPQSGSRVGDSMMFGLIEHAERIEESMAETQRVLAERIKELTQVKAWAVQASVDLQKRARHRHQESGDRAEQAAAGECQPGPERTVGDP